MVVLLHPQQIDLEMRFVRGEDRAAGAAGALAVVFPAKAGIH